MTLPVFPTDLPKPLVAGYRAQRQDARRKTSFDAGPPKFSRRFSAAGRTISLQFRLELWQKAVLDRFYIETLAEGSLPFWMTDYLVDGSALLDEGGLPLLDELGIPLLSAKTMLCTWGDAPAVESNPVIRRQTISFSVWEHPT